MRYLIQAEDDVSDTATINTTGLATPDTLTDSVGSGVIKQESKVVAQGYGQFAAAAQTTNKMRALWASDYTFSDPSSGSPFGGKLVPTSVCTITPRSGAALWIVDQSAAAPLVPTIVVTATGGTGFAYLDIESPGTIGA